MLEDVRTIEVELKNVDGKILCRQRINANVSDMLMASGRLTIRAAECIIKNGAHESDVKELLGIGELLNNIGLELSKNTDYDSRDDMN